MSDSACETTPFSETRYHPQEWRRTKHCTFTESTACDPQTGGPSETGILSSSSVAARNFVQSLDAMRACLHLELACELVFLKR